MTINLKNFHPAHLLERSKEGHFVVSYVYYIESEFSLLGIFVSEDIKKISDVCENENPNISPALETEPYSLSYSDKNNLLYKDNYGEEKIIPISGQDYRVLLNKTVSEACMINNTLKINNKLYGIDLREKKHRPVVIPSKKLVYSYEAF